jgi:hypothetical protein
MDVEDVFNATGHSLTARKMVFENKAGYYGDNANPEKEKLDAFKKKYNIDLTKPLWKQVSCLGKEEYNDFINDPKHLIDPPRDVPLYSNPILELVSKTPWWLILAVWVPFVTVIMINSSSTLF